MMATKMIKKPKGQSSLSWEASLTKTAKLTRSLAQKIVLYKDDDIIAINKPPGLAVQGDPNASLVSQMGYWQYDSPRPPGLGHRIDKDTTGVLLLTRNSKSAQRIRELIENKQIIKKYWAITINVPEKTSGSITIPLSTKNIATSKSKSLYRVILRTDKAEDFSKEKAGSKLYGSVCLAWTDYTVISRKGSISSLLDINLRTGFKHQIRAHLADGLCCPVLGDYLFAGPWFRKEKSLVRKIENIGSHAGYVRGPLYLHAYEVSIPREGGQDPIVINATLPKYFISTLNALGLRVPYRYAKLAR
ncbi:PREDICTED: RNA pseudouridylate synthase domain-containing protein 4-like [Amphimedon queenslandica]|uniref:Pseudouridylate synthase RPUSD4, mitochondrial n=1 Tax=Amphimedon queenslandica TaxID=400682 RepID=A0A1X7VRW0_AMPQE|nr:PREDICTED: RNA pseudouridylate synthase domain-containing protein 4-like [Amphimedon queenslandica]|eukprot:XP_019854970.1 PREDICTED: RNA pseudouridylate synthase domain-containing protein 4-like [Amphimedon queenslandica]